MEVQNLQRRGRNEPLKEETVVKKKPRIKNIVIRLIKIDFLRNTDKFFRLSYV